MNLDVPGITGNGGTNYLFGGGFEVSLITEYNEESDPETGDPITVSNYTLDVFTTTNTYTALYFSTTAF